MSAESDYANEVSRILWQRGRAEAEGKLGQGQAWGHFAEQLGKLPGQLMSQYQEAKGFEKDQQLRDQQIASNKALEQDRQQQFAANARKQQEDAQFRQTIRDTANLPYDEARRLVAQHAPEHLATWEKGYADLKDKADISAKNRAEYAKAQQEYLGIAADHIAQSNGDPIVVNQELNLATEHYPEWAPHANQLRIVAIEQGKDAFLNAFKSLVPASVTKARTDTADTLAQLPGHVASTQIQQQIAAGMQNGLTPDQQRQQQQAEAVRAQQAAAAAETARHNRETEAATRQAHADAQGDKTDLTPAGLDAAAMMFAKTGQLPALGMGDKTTRKAIINRAAELTPGLDVASAKADFTANQASLSAMQKQRDTISAFEQTASKNIDIFLETAGKVVDTGSPLLNTPVRIVTGKLLGSPNQAQYDAARQVAVNEIAKITQGGGLSGVLSDSARKEIGDFNPANATLKQTVAVLRTLKRDMANRASALDDQVAAIKTRIGKASTTVPTVPTVDLVFDPKTGTFTKPGAQ